MKYAAEVHKQNRVAVNILAFSPSSSLPPTAQLVPGATGSFVPQPQRSPVAERGRSSPHGGQAGTGMSRQAVGHCPFQSSF